MAAALVPDGLWDVIEPLSASFVPSLFGWLPQSLLGWSRGRRTYVITQRVLKQKPVLLTFSSPS